jgi:hypothetical protein
MKIYVCAYVFPVFWREKLYMILHVRLYDHHLENAHGGLARCQLLLEPMLSDGFHGSGHRFL